MATIKYRLSAKTDKTSGLNEILVRFFHGRIDQYGKTNIFIERDTWNEKTQRVTIPRFRVMSPENEERIAALSVQNERLEKLERHIQAEFIKAGAGKIDLPADWLERLLLAYNFPAEADGVNTIGDAFERFISTSKLGISRQRHYRVVMRAYQRFAKYKGLSESLESINGDSINAFVDFLKEEHNLAWAVPGSRPRQIAFANKEYERAFKAVPESRLPMPRGDNAIYSIMFRLKTLCTWAKEQGLTDNVPFKNYEMGKCIYGTPYYLTIQERNQVYNYDFSKNKNLEIIRDIFVFQCVIGCRVSDLKKLTKQSVQGDIVQYIPRKTKHDRAVVVRVPLNSIAREILAKYRDLPGEALLPCPKYDCDYNEGIKEVCRLAGLNRVVVTLNPTTREEEQHPIWEVASSQIARRCFIGNLYKQVKDPNLVGKLSGHKEGSNAFARYRDIDEETTRELVAMLE